MLKYKNKNFDPLSLHPLHIDRQSMNLIPCESRVLDIGCATGFMGEYLIKKKHCRVIGVDLRKDEIRQARKKLTKVIEGDIEDKKVVTQIRELEKFDMVYASALIEHLKDPWSALKTWRAFLRKNGLILLTTSNIAHWSIRLNMLQGKFNYEEYGILDNTHLRFFTPNTFRQLVKNCGFNIVRFSIDPVGGGYPKISWFLSHFFPDLFAYQMLIQAKIP